MEAEPQEQNMKNFDKDATLIADEEGRPKSEREDDMTADDGLSMTIAGKEDVKRADHVQEDREFKKERQSLILERVQMISKRRRMSQRIISSLGRGNTEKLHTFRWRWYYAVFLFSFISLLFCMLQLFLPPPFGVMMTSAQIQGGCENGLKRCICPRQTICAKNTLSIVLLTLARCTVFFDYPLYMMMFISKCHNVNNLCRRTVLREWIDFSDMHKVHKIFGIVVGIETMSHSFFHMLRWGLNRDNGFSGLLLGTRTGITGLIAMIITPFVCWPMVVPALKTNVQFEVRKGLHYLAVVWAITLVWHAPSRIYYLIGIPALIYAADYFCGFFIRNALIENAHFERIGETGVSLYFKNPQKWGDKPKTSYVYIMCPWISKYQWHAFTMFPEPNKENHTMLCIAVSGGWTKELHDKIKVPSFKSLYVQGPYLSEFSDTAVTTSNAIAVASGIGITPTLSLMLNYADKKRINIIWMCRDAGLIEYILHKVDIDEIMRNSYAFIFYTGKRELALPEHLPVNVFIFNTRPNLEESIAGIITAIHTGDGLPEELYETQLKISNTSFHMRMQVALCRVMEIYGPDEMFEYAVEQTKKKLMRESKAELDMFYERNDPEAAPLKSNVPADDAVSLEGLNAMISEFCGGIGVYSRTELEEMFDEIDRDGAGFISKEDFDAFLLLATTESSRPTIQALASTMDKMLMTSLALQQSVHGQSPISPSSWQVAVSVMESLIQKSDNKGLFKDWSIFYCGGSNAIKNNLKEIATKYGIDFAVEKFDW